LIGVLSFMVIFYSVLEKQ